MIIDKFIALGLALPTGALFGVGYGTGVRIGYEQVYPLLFPKTDTPRTPEQTVKQVKQLNQIYDTIGGKEASQMGIAKGLNDALTEVNNNPDFRDLLALESTQSGRIPSSSNKHSPSEPTPSSSQQEDPKSTTKKPSSISITFTYKDSDGKNLTLTKHGTITQHAANVKHIEQSLSNATHPQSMLQQLLKYRTALHAKTGKWY